MASEKPADDLDKLLGELDAHIDSSMARLPTFAELVASVARSRGSDLFLVTGSAPMMRVDGALVPLANSWLTAEQIETIVYPAMDDKALEQYRTTGAADASVRIDSIGRFRVNLHHERRNPAAAIRILPNRVPQISELRLPAEIAQLSSLTSGLVLIGGATGSGKTTTQAALIDAINQRDAKHIVTVED